MKPYVYEAEVFNDVWSVNPGREPSCAGEVRRAV